MEPIKVVIADDDEGMRLIERRMIARVEGFTLAGEAKDGDELLALVEKLRPQVVFLDVEMPGKTGVECAKVIQDTDPSIVMIFATAHDQYMGDAFEVYAFDYLLKPFKVDRVMQTLERARDRISHVNDAPLPELPKAQPRPATGRLMLRHKEGVSFINMSDILLVQREERATVMYTADGKRYVIPETLSEIMEKLPQEAFLRSHKSYIVNIDAIDSISPYGRWTYVVKLRGTEHDALITHEKFEELEKRFS